MVQAAGQRKRVRFAKQTARDVYADPASGKSLRRTSSDIDLDKEILESNEIRDDEQVEYSRHGVRRVSGTINGELSPRTYADFMAAALRRDFTAVDDIEDLTITISAVGKLWKLHRSAGDWLHTAVKRGKVIRLAGAGLNLGNANKNLLVVGVTAGDLMVKSLNKVPMIAEGPIADVSVTIPGKETFVPSTGHTDDFFTIEHWFSDILRSEVFDNCQPTQIDLQLPPTGLATIGVQVMGRDRVSDDTDPYFTTVEPATSTGLTAAVNGAALVDGVVVSDLTGFNFSMLSPKSGEATVGTDTIENSFRDAVRGDGQFTSFFRDGLYANKFDKEQDIEIIAVLTTSSANNADFISFAMPRVSVNGGKKSDGKGGITQTVPFKALKALTGGDGFGNELTTIYVQDSAA